MHNVLLITVDCLRADCLRPSLTPHLCRLADRAWDFRQAFATGIRTAESFPGILTSTYPLAFGGAWRLPPHLVSLAQLLQGHGYATAAFHSNPFLSASMGYERGFDHFWDSQEQTPLTSRLGARLMPHLSTGSRLYRLLRRLVRTFEAETGLAHYVRAAEVNERAVAWLARQQAPFFIWLHYMDLHYPYAPPAGYVRRLRPQGVSGRRQAELLTRSLECPHTVTREEAQILRDLYDAALLYADENAGALLQSLERLGQRDDTIIILTGDHGEEFLEHGEFGHGGNVHLEENGQARVRLYDELLHVPLLVALPQSSPAPRPVEALASLADLPPTVAGLLGLAPAPAWQGVSLLPLLEGAATEVHAGLFAEYAVRAGKVRHPVVAYRTKEWKYMHDGASAHHELYNLQQDPGERHNLYRRDHPALFPLQAAVRRHLALAEAGPYPVVEAGMDPAMVERLRNLGYVE